METDLVEVPAGKKGVVESGSAEDRTVPAPFGAPGDWAVPQLLGISLGIALRRPQLWGPLMVLQGLLSTLPIVGPLLVVPVGTTVAIAATTAAVRGEEWGGIAEALRGSRAHLPAVLRTQLLSIFLLSAMIGGWAITMGMLAAVSPLAAALGSCVAGGVTFWYLMTHIFYSTQVAVIEGEGGFAALARAREATLQARHALLGAPALVLLSIYGATAVAVDAFARAGAARAAELWGSAGQLVGTLGISAILGAVIMVLGQISWTLLYLRARDGRGAGRKRGRLAPPEEPAAPELPA